VTKPLSTADKIQKLLEPHCTVPTARRIARAAVGIAYDPPRLATGDHRNLDWPTRAFALAMKIEELRGDSHEDDDDSGHVGD